MDGSEFGSGNIPRRGIPGPGPSMVPYGATGSGHAGNDTSRERQEREDALGATAWRQAQALQMITEARSGGVTVREYEQEFGLHHGQASSALSHLHRAGHVVRLKMRRSAQEIYVLPAYINGRDESPYRPREGRKHPRFVSEEGLQHAMKSAGIPSTPVNIGTLRRFLEALP